MLLLYALARPILSSTAASSTGNSTVFDPITGECDSIYGCRTGSQILWNCLSVIFICTWVAIHPNVPHVKAHRAVVLFCNGMLMAIAMLAPELIILWAIKQRYSAKAIAEKYKKYGWGMAHGFLIIMGGFALYDGDKFCGYLWNDDDKVGKDTRKTINKYHQKIRGAIAELEAEDEEKQTGQTVEDLLEEADRTHLIPVWRPEIDADTESLNEDSLLLEYLLKNGHIRITEDEIMDNLSHSDSITKTIAVIQTAWFLLQVGARAIERLAITELEIITVGFAVLNFGTYFLWWNKPLRVRHPVRVYWRQQEIAGKSDENDDAKGWMVRILGFVVGVWDTVRDAFVEFGESAVVLCNFLKDPTEKCPELNDNSLPNMNWVILLQLVGLPFLVVLRLIFASICIVVDESDDDKYMASIISFSRLKRRSFTLYILVYGLTTLFGAIHCIPWNFQFPTHMEQLLWRISAGGLVALPLTLLVVMAIGVAITLVDDAIDSRFGEDSRIYKTMKAITFKFIGYPTLAIGVALPFAYIIARVILMVLALMELRNLPQSAYQTVQWTSFIPHIG